MTEERQGILNGQESGHAEEEGLLAGTRTLNRGEIVKARVVQVHDDLAFVDVGWKSDLPITKEELSLQPVASAKEAVRVGEEIEVMVVKADEEEGIILSKRRADQERRWRELEEALARGEPVTGRVMEVVKGGLVVDVGVRGFVPASQAALSYVADLAPFVGETWTMRLLEVDRAKRRVVLSRRAILAEEREKAKAEAFARLKEGDVVEGRVTRLVNFGAFVDLGAGVEGLLHVSEIAWERVKDPAERLAVGQEIKVQVIKVDPEAKKISLSLKALHPHPWTGVAERFPEGSIVPGKVVRLAPFGAFVRVAEGIAGLVHLSQLAERRVGKPEEVVSVGQEVKVKVLKVDEANRRLSLSMRAVTEEAAKEEVKSFLEGQEDGKVTIAELVRQKQEGS
ncbi:MAG: 30S ribosomal protein S1 [Firmicutes bacterium]|nr:30S ribosomal protein S1 [Bacillota bacterium]